MSPDSPDDGRPRNDWGCKLTAQGYRPTPSPKPAADHPTHRQRPGALANRAGPCYAVDISSRYIGSGRQWSTMDRWSEIDGAGSVVRDRATRAPPSPAQIDGAGEQDGARRVGDGHPRPLEGTGAARLR